MKSYGKAFPLKSVKHLLTDDSAPIRMGTGEWDEEQDTLDKPEVKEDHYKDVTQS